MVAPIYPPIVATQRTFNYRQTINAVPARMFSLLCPQREHEWLPGWQARMIHSHSGVAEAGAVFATPCAATAGTQETLWYTVTHQAPELVRFVRFQPNGVVVDIAIEVASDPAQAQQSLVDICYRFTATSVEGEAVVQVFDESQWLAMMQEWQALMNAWLAAHPD